MTCSSRRLGGLKPVLLTANVMVVSETGQVESGDGEDAGVQFDADSPLRQRLSLASPFAFRSTDMGLREGLTRCGTGDTQEGGVAQARDSAPERYSATTVSVSPAARAFI